MPEQNIEDVIQQAPRQIMAVSRELIIAVDGTARCTGLPLTCQEDVHCQA